MASPVPAKSHPHHHQHHHFPEFKCKKPTNNHHRGRLEPPPRRNHSPLFDPPTPMRDPVPRSSPLRDSPIRDPAPRQSPSRRRSDQAALMRDQSAPRQSPVRDLASESDGFVSKNRKSMMMVESVKAGFTASDNIEKSAIGIKESDHTIEKSVEKERKSKICIRLRPHKPSDDVLEEGKPESPAAESQVVEEEPPLAEIEAAAAAAAEESVPKTWNLRPRKAAPQKPNPLNGGSSKNGGMSPQENKAQASPQNKRAPNGEEKKQKRRTFAIALTREEIEEDVFAMTGARPSRRPKKRPRTVQRQIDVVLGGKICHAHTLTGEATVAAPTLVDSSHQWKNAHEVKGAKGSSCSPNTIGMALGSGCFSDFAIGEYSNS
ncbi:hypothetical protein RJ640_014583 [Escallonia rubra]|uniref:Uncharacterized protein n=1 Tax=Escallonia rubra TaxID=112253 RepID=A0AA88UJR5_9ASTE|nr:hypothetical protein RJ640_014583 [Escallonia rubra]